MHTGGVLYSGNSPADEFLNFLLVSCLHFPDLTPDHTITMTFTFIITITITSRAKQPKLMSNEMQIWCLVQFNAKQDKTIYETIHCFAMLYIPFKTQLSVTYGLECRNPDLSSFSTCLCPHPALPSHSLSLSRSLPLSPPVNLSVLILVLRIIGIAT